MLWIIVLLLLYIGLGFIPANIANKKGYSFGLYWLFGFFFFVPALMVSLLISDKNAPQQYYDNYRRKNESQTLYNSNPSEGFWRCSSCGTTNDRNAVFCKSCGEYK